MLGEIIARVMKLTPPFFALSCVPWPKALLLSFASSLLTMLQVLGAAPHFETEIVPILTQAGCNAADPRSSSG
ncbi:MAG: hypothetical protein EBU26_09270 [Verrucomicrobia bacterium]|nr:hypothetical protein [Verrucomicrobiota bacterium]